MPRQPTTPAPLWRGVRGQAKERNMKRGRRLLQENIFPARPPTTSVSYSMRVMSAKSLSRRESS